MLWVSKLLLIALSGPDGFGDLPDDFGDPSDGAKRAFFGFEKVVFLGLIGFAVLVVLIIAIAIRTQRRERKRVADLRSWARRQEFTFADQDDSLSRYFLGWPFEQGHNRRCRHVIRGRVAGYPATMFDYTYVTDSMSSSSEGMSSSTTSHFRQVIVVELPVPWPSLSLVPSGLGSKIAVSFGGQDHQIGHAEFDRRFRVRGDDEQGIRRLLLPMAPALLAWPDQIFRIDGPVLVTHRQGWLTAADLDRWLADLSTAVTSANG